MSAPGAELSHADHVCAPALLVLEEKACRDVGDAPVTEETRDRRLVASRQHPVSPCGARGVGQSPLEDSSWLAQ